MALIVRAAVLALLAGVVPVHGTAQTVKPEALTSSATCAQCHQEIHSMWKRSMHGLSFSDPIFQVSYMRAYMETGGEASKTCLRCHAPAAALSGDFELNDPISREGITCDYCHSVASVDLSHTARPYEVRLDGVKRGPLGDARSPAHKVARSLVHESAEFCGGCHEYTTAEGLAVISTYSEWKAGPYAKEGKTCQSCHMPSMPGSTVRADLGVRRREINLHDISGGHSADQVRRAAQAKILRFEREAPDRAVVEVEVANVGSGHAIPTGLPTRKLVLEALLFVDGQQVRRFERTYQRTLLDRDGRRIVEDHRTILDAHRLLEDNRLLPGERRVERFVASVAPRGKLGVEVHLNYVYQPELLHRETMSVPITSERAPQ